MEDDTDPETTGRRLVYFAAERTLMAWIRAALSLMALGFVIDRFGLVLRQILPAAGETLHPKSFSFWAGTVPVIIGTLMAVAAAVRYLLFTINYQREGRTSPGRGLVIGVIFTVITAVIGFIIVFFLVIVTD